MILGILTFLSALTISAVAIYYSVAGLVAIFAAAAVPIIIMGGALEVGKLVTAVWLHKYWQQATWWLKTYLTTAVIILMFITSMGIFGFLSKAHIEQTSASVENVAQIEQINKQIAGYQAIINRAEEQIKKLETTGTGADQNIQSQIDRENLRIDTAYDRVQPAIDATNKKLEQDISLYTDQIENLDRKITEFETASDIDTNDKDQVKQLQALVGASPDGAYGGGTARAVKAYIDDLNKQKQDLFVKIESLKETANEEIKRLRSRAEKEIDDSNALIERLRSQLGQDTGVDIQSEIDTQTTRITDANTELDALTKQKFEIESEYRKLEAEVGPIKYIAEFIYGEQADKNMLEEAVRWVIIVIIVVFDPLAVLLLIASQYTFEWNRKNGGVLPPKQDPDPEPDDTQSFTDKEWEEAHRDNYEFDRAKRIDTNEPPSFEEPKQEAVLSKKKTDQYLLWQDVDPDPQESVEELEIEPQKSVDPDQLELDFQERFENETEEEYVKRIWKKENPNLSIEYIKKAKDEGKIDKLPWEEVDHTINDMKSKGEWPDQASQQSQDAVSEQLEQIDDLDAWNSWVEKANEEAEKNPESFEQNSEQSESSMFNKINEARQNFDPKKVKELEITEEQYRDASQKHIISLIDRLKKGLINVEDLTELEANKITKLLDKS